MVYRVEIHLTTKENTLLIEANSEAEVTNLLNTINNSDRRLFCLTTPSLNNEFWINPDHICLVTVSKK